jgi:hypothetical protein
VRRLGRGAAVTGDWGSHRRLRGDSATVTCPYCFEPVELYVDPETEGTFVQDCDVCCRPWSVSVSRDDDGELTVDVGRAQ